MKYALVTGSTKGIGKSIAQKLLENDYFVFVNYCNDDLSANNFTAEFNDYKDKFVIIKEDLSNYSGAVSLVNKIKEVTNQIDVVILNCGTTDKSKYGEISKENWERNINLNLNVPFYIVQLLDSYIVNTDGRIIFISSVMGKYSHSTSLSYNVSKAAVNALSNSLVKYYSDRNITVNSILPGFIDTPYHDNRSKESYDKICSKIALHRFGKSNEVASLVLEIIKNQYINGSNIDINGGYNYY